MDNGTAHRHMNNTTYYAFFDTIVNQYPIENGVSGCRKKRSHRLGIAETTCSYFKSLGFPSKVTVGLRVGRLGTTSIRYEIGLFDEQADEASAQGHFVHVYVNRETGRPVQLPEALRSVVSGLTA